MAMTFTALAKLGDFKSPPSAAIATEPIEEKQVDVKSEQSSAHHGPMRLGGLVYNIQIVLPESRDPAVYDALFQSLRKHLV